MRGSCKWTLREAYIRSDWDVWDTECDKSFTFDTGDPTENEFAFCPFCGKYISVDSAQARGGKRAIEE